MKLNEKKFREQLDFEKNATFKPNLTAKYKSKSPCSGQASASSLNKRNSTSRSLRQFIEDQNSHMFKAQKKVDAARASKKADERKQITGRPQLSVKS